MKKLLPIVLFVVIAAVAAYFLVFANSNSNDQSGSSQITEVAQSNESAQSSPSVDTSTKFTAAQVAERNSADDCWTIINGKVYDLTRYIPRHPGGDDILLACGTDGTSLFEDRTTNDGRAIGGGGSHSSSAESSLKSLQIGSLQE